MQRIPVLDAGDGVEEEEEEADDDEEEEEEEWGSEVGTHCTSIKYPFLEPLRRSNECNPQFTMLSPPFVQLIFHNCMYCTNGPCLVETANTRSLVTAWVGNDGNGAQAIAPTSLPTFNKKRVPFSSDAESPVLANVEEVEEDEEDEEDEAQVEEEEDDDDDDDDNGDDDDDDEVE